MDIHHRRLGGVLVLKPLHYFYDEFSVRSLLGVYTALRVLQQLGLVKEERGKGFPNVVLTSLTEKGKKVAKMVGEIGGVLKKE